jgi:uncharacterized protein YjiS (DUF1127 family)
MTKKIPSRFLMNVRIHENLLRAEAAAAAARSIAQFVKHLVKAFRQRRQIAALAALDDRTLRDIGLSHDEVHHAASQSFWVNLNGKPIARRNWLPGGSPTLDALARLGDDQLGNLSETGQWLRREARHPR